MSTTPSGEGGRPALVGLIIAVSMTTIDQTIVALCAPTVETDLALTHDAMQWAVNVYLVATAACFLLGGRLADVVGHKRMALIGIASFGATSLLCGLAPVGDWAATWLIAARALQGVAGALMFPAAIGIVVRGFPREGRAKAMATFFGITGAMTAIGPIAGGYLTQWTWRSVFWVNVPLTIVSFAVVALTARPGERRRERVDVPGALVIAAGLGLLVFGLQQAGSWGWASAGVIGSLVAGALLVVLFAVVESRTREPLMNPRVLRDRGFAVSGLAMFFAAAAFLATFFFLSVYGQVALGLGATQTGLLFLKFFIGFVVAAQVGSRRFDRSGARGVYLIGGLAGAAGFLWLARAATTIPDRPGAFVNGQTLPIMLAGAGIGFMLSAASTDAVNRSIGASYGEVTAVSQTLRNLGGALGIAVLTTVVTNRLTARLIHSFTGLGASAAEARAAVARVGGTGAGGRRPGRRDRRGRRQRAGRAAPGGAPPVPRRRTARLRPRRPLGVRGRGDRDGCRGAALLGLSAAPGVRGPGGGGRRGGARIGAG
ncbi:MFS transporter [Streptomyces sp. LaBMicrA B280]|uniref:MFS transporter n=1 Tax=Streptomyces sp. LaBMicrA B280 TaxID=3391001 RepID=UPI003BA4383E